jgi:hypothetical protein
MLTIFIVPSYQQQISLSKLVRLGLPKFYPKFCFPSVSVDAESVMVEEERKR